MGKTKKVKRKSVGRKTAVSKTPKKMKAYASFAAWKRDQTAKHQRLIAKLAKVVEKAAPEFERFVKWGQGCWTLEDKPKVFIHAASDHLQLGFYMGSKLRDPKKLLVGSGKYVRHIKVFTERDILPSAFASLIKQVR